MWNKILEIPKGSYVKFIGIDEHGRTRELRGYVQSCRGGWVKIVLTGFDDVKKGFFPYLRAKKIEEVEIIGVDTE